MTINTSSIHISIIISISLAFVVFVETLNDLYIYISDQYLIYFVYFVNELSGIISMYRGIYIPVPFQSPTSGDFLFLVTHTEFK